MTIAVDAKFEKIEMVAGYVPSADKDVATKDYVSQFSLPVGTIAPYGGSSAPSGWLLCDGQSVDRTTYAALFAVIGTTFGSVDGSSFNLPDLRGRVPVALDNMGGSSANRITAAWADSLGGADGAETHLLMEAEMPAHNHPQIHRPSGSGGTTYPNWPNGMIAGATSQFGSSITGPAGGGQPHNNIQPSMALTYIIKS